MLKVDLQKPKNNKILPNKREGWIKAKYNEGSPETYKGIEAEVRTNQGTVSANLFFTKGNPVFAFQLDLDNATEWLEKNEQCTDIIQMSSIDNFMMDHIIKAN